MESVQHEGAKTADFLSAFRPSGDYLPVCLLVEHRRKTYLWIYLPLDSETGTVGILEYLDGTSV